MLMASSGIGGHVTWKISYKVQKNIFKGDTSTQQEPKPRYQTKLKNNLRLSQDIC